MMKDDLGGIDKRSATLTAVASNLKELARHLRKQKKTETTCGQPAEGMTIPKKLADRLPHKQLVHHLQNGWRCQGELYVTGRQQQQWQQQKQQCRAQLQAKRNQHWAGRAAAASATPLPTPFAAPLPAGWPGVR